MDIGTGNKRRETYEPRPVHVESKPCRTTRGHTHSNSEHLVPSIPPSLFLYLVFYLTMCIHIFIERTLTSDARKAMIFCW